MQFPIFWLKKFEDTYNDALAIGMIIIESLI
jgi:hypothetical protein